MPGRITLDEAIASTAGAPEQPAAKRRITFDEANSSVEAAGRVGFRTEVKPGEEFSPGAYLDNGQVRRPKIYEAPQPAAESNFGAAFKDSFAQDEGTRLRLIADQIFPGDPKGIERVGIRNGKPVFVNDEGKLQYVSSTAGRVIGGIAGSAPEIAGGVAGSFSGLPVIGSTAGATIGRALKRGISNLVFDEPVTAGSLGKELAVEAGTNLVGGLLAKGGTKFIDRGRVVDFAPQRLSQAEQIRAAVKSRTGIDLDLAQASGDRRLIRLRDFAARYPGKTAEIIQAQDDIAAGQFDSATQRVLNTLSVPIPEGRVGELAINAADEVIQGTRRSISAQVQPLYDAAYAAKQVVTNPRIKSLVKLPEVESALKEARGILNLRAGKVIPLKEQPLSLQLLDETKKQLDDQVSKLRTGGDRNKASALAGVRDDIRGFLDNVSGLDIAGPGQPANVISLYQQARSQYARLAQEQLEPLENGLVGTLARLDPKTASEASDIFLGRSVNPQSVALLKAKLSKQDPQAYRSLVRDYLSKQYNKAQGLTQGGDLVNVPGKFLNYLAKTPNERDTLRAILPPDSVGMLDDVLDAAQLLARTPLGASRIAGSNTAGDLTLSEILKGRGIAIAKALSTPRQAIREAAELRAQEQGVEALTDALIDPAKRSQLRRIVRMKDSTKRAILLGTLLGAKGTAESGADLTENAGAGQ